LNSDHSFPREPSRDGRSYERFMREIVSLNDRQKLI
jgi:hypothetical protein